jgi:plasmid stabilization system protein ParE
MRVEWSAAALADLNRFRAFLRERHSRLADLVGRAIEKRTTLLADFPLLGRSLREKAEYRELVVTALNAKYVVQYRVDGETLTIVRVFHGRERREDDA